MKLDENIYFSKEANLEYVSASQYKLFFNPYVTCCEAAALAEIRGEITRPVSKSLLIGSFVDEALTGDLDKFKNDHPDLFITRGDRKGELKADFIQAEQMVARAKKDSLFMAYLTGGEYQRIFTGEVNGVPVKVKLDHLAYKDGKPVAIVDLKTVKSMTESFYVRDSGEYMSWAERWLYDLQGALYQRIVEQNIGLQLPFYLAAISKDKDSDGTAHPRLKIIQIPQIKMDERFTEFEQNVRKIDRLKKGEIEPIHCGKCDYCADTLPCEVISMDELLLDV